MAQERLSMRKIKAILRLKYDCGLSLRQIATSCQMAESTVWTYLRRAEAAAVSWPLPDGLTDEALEAQLFRSVSNALFRPNSIPLPDFARIHEELRTHQKVNLTLDLLWREYKEQHPDGYRIRIFAGSITHRNRKTLVLASLSLGSSSGGRSFRTGDA